VPAFSPFLVWSGGLLIIDDPFQDLFVPGLTIFFSTRAYPFYLVDKCGELPLCERGNHYLL
jgi:hypothetical protein